MTDLEKLQRIRARCVELLAIAEKRTPGEWRVGRISMTGFSLLQAGPDWGSDAVSVQHKTGDAAFIASCAGAAEAGWRSTIAAIDGWAINGFHPMNPNDDTGSGPKNCVCRHCQAIKTILAAWPDNLLK